jgi:stearoyl-CoA desaturase (delta-9 desaturase)
MENKPLTSAQAREAVPRSRGLITEPTYGWGELAPRRPTARECIDEWLDAVDFSSDRAKVLTAAYAVFHLATFAAFLAFLATSFSLGRAAAVLGIAAFIATLYNTVWYHRYCTHRAYKLRRVGFARAFLWTNPVCFREENYVIPHHVHHAKHDQPGDPYGPHLGWLGSYLASESTAKTNRDISASDYVRLARSLKHIGFPQSSYDEFRRSGSIEQPWHYVARSVFANALWAGLAWSIAGGSGVLTWYAGVFVYSFLVRDFNYRGHGGVFGNAFVGNARNQPYYGLIGGEWHANHHAHPRLAHSGMEWWQLDLPYWIIKAMHALGLVSELNVLVDRALREPSRGSASAPPVDASFSGPP